MAGPRRSPDWRPWRAAGALAILLAAGCGAGAATEVRVEPAEFEVRGPGDATALVPIVFPFEAGQALVPGLEAYGAPDPAPGTAPTFVAANPTHEGFPLVVSVVDASPDGDWLHVRFPQRPNGTTGWVRRADLQLWGLDNRIEVSVSQRTLRVLDGDTGAALFETSVSVGSDVTPTPLGEFFIDIVNPLGDHPTYGWGQLSVSGFSDVLQTFEGGIGQIAIHGWNRPADMGRNVSNGCVRMTNADIALVASLAPLGTPVTIVA